MPSSEVRPLLSFFEQEDLHHHNLNKKAPQAVTPLNIIPATWRGNNAVMIKPKMMVNEEMKGGNKMEEI